ncbi:MAG: penicillin-binding protein 2 [Calditrichaceae bacterium]|nr:penicillin-binding protein 2 [Calditrichaceae bacterium]RQV96660.1 MAG: penicillin-binding protein 2 [Calditrichota bacterium]
MTLNDKLALHQKRLLYSGIMGIAFIILAVGFINLQIGQQEQYEERSRDNFVRKIVQTPVRGLIHDRDGDILVDSRASYMAALIPRNASEKSIQFVCDVLKLNIDEIKEQLTKQYGFRPVIIARDIDYEQLVRLEENRLTLPGVITMTEPKRYYPPDVMSPHIFGTIGEISKSEHTVNEMYEPGDMIGKSGIEKKYDSDLRGVKGAEYIRVDAAGKELGQYDPSQNHQPLHGSDLHLFLDYRMQLFAESLFVDKLGALAAIDVRNGAILALVSKPDYDPRMLAGKIDQDVWLNLMSDQSHPLYSRAIQSAYPPGSTYKIVAAIAALQENIITPRWKAYCPGYFQIGRKTIHCWNLKGHGTLDLLGAIKNSCNVYFLQLGLKIGLDEWSKYSKMLAFGKRTGIDLPNENTGLVPTTEYMNKVYGVNGWTKGNLANLAIGQGELLVTPIQLAQFAMILANKGVYHTPHLVDYYYDYSKKSKIVFPTDTKYVTGISDEVYDIVREGMRQVCDGGTGWLGKVPEIETAGKTGTAQNPHGDTHAWFMGFAPFDRPEIAVAVIVENAGSGGGIAAPMARKFMEMHFFGRLIPRPVVKKDSLNTLPVDSAISPVNIDVITPMQIRPILPEGNQ